MEDKKQAESQNPKNSSAKRTSRFSDMLLQVTTDLAKTKSLDEALEVLVKITTSTIGAERGTIFLNDPATGELYSRIAQGNFRREIRILNTKGVAGWAFTKNEGVIIHDAYKDERFNKAVDVRTGFRTKSILCAPLRTVNGDEIGVSQILNKIDGEFDQNDLDMLEAMTEQAAIAIQGNIIVEQIEAARKQELEFLDVVSQVSSELELTPLLQKIITTISTMLDCERATLFINDEKTNELYTEVGEGLDEKSTIRIPNHLGISGAVFTSGKAVNIPHAYADLRFNPSFDKQTGFFTRSILCMPVFSKAGKTIGVSQVLNKRGGSFNAEDEKRLAAFTSQISMGIENAKLFDDVQSQMNYSQSILSSMHDAVLTFDEHGVVKTCNPAGLRILKVPHEAAILEQQASVLFGGPNEWLLHKLEAVHENEEFLDAEIQIEGETLSVNITLTPLMGKNEKRQEVDSAPKDNIIGAMLMIEDISSEKRMKSTMSRYMDPELADQLMTADGNDDDIMGGKQSVGTVLFSDVRSFTTITEELGAQGTVKLLNDYFTIMVDCITDEGGMLDKFIGDAMMCIFGTPVPHEDDPDRAVRAAIRMMTDLKVFNDKRSTEGKMPIDHGMGINTDSIVSGNIGSPKRMDYTVIGDGVNLAARIESACKQYGAHILISEFTHKAVKATYRTRQVDYVIVKGKTEPVGVYEVLDFHDDESYPNLVEALGLFNDGYRSWNLGKWDQATKLFNSVKKINPNDKAAQLYIDRCNHMKKNPPKGTWDGVWVMTSK
ncbi:MAG: adenylate/guanylate cyclase domain-containing protein [Opitutae bacterium]|nr:adenylate/guanylate cyclase domain-containing protein [Opitutae bacterium]|tara:strand:- start:8147 stop:10471 length:2325 start_codon:yes stop_codon:yes gene_type:complete